MTTPSISMKRYFKFKFILLCLIVFTSFSTSCKKAVKELSEDATEKVAKSTAKDLSEETIEKLTRKEIRSLNWNDIIKVISKKTPATGEAFERLDKGVQKSLSEAATKDLKFFKALSSSNSVLDECTVYSKEANKLLKDANFIRMYVRSNTTKRLGKKCFLNEFVAKEGKGAVCFYNKTTNKLVAEYHDGIVKTFDESILNSDLIPNACYKIIGKTGKKCSFFIDDLGRVSRVQATNMSPNEIVSGIINRTGNNDFGNEWVKSLKKLKQSSRGEDVNINCKFNYVNEDDVIPKYAHIEASTNGKKQISSTFKNSVKRTGSTFTEEENRAILSKYSTKLGLSSDKVDKLLSEMNADEGLAALIHENPNLNISRWAKTRNHVDQKLIVKSPKGRMPQNARTYAGNVYYFNPHLNSGLMARLKNGNGVINLRGMGHLTYDDLIKLDKLYPDGVPFTKQGFPDFSFVAAKGKDGSPIIVDIGKLSGDSKKDISIAETIFQKQGNKWQGGYTWHHIENTTTLMRVPTNIHQLIDHSGGMSTHNL